MSAIVTYPTTENLHADTSKITLDKILQALNGGAGGGGSGAALATTGSPEGVLTADNLQFAWDATNDVLWVHEGADGTNTGWHQIV